MQILNNQSLALYESSVLRNASKEETAKAYLELARYMKKCCMRLLKTNQKKALHCASLADLNWRKSTSFYHTETYHVEFLLTLVDMSSLSLELPNIPEEALSILFEGHLISETAATYMEFWKASCPGVCPAFWSELQKIFRTLDTLRN